MSTFHDLCVCSMLTFIPELHAYISEIVLRDTTAVLICCFSSRMIRVPPFTKTKLNLAQLLLVPPKKRSPWIKRLFVLCALVAVGALLFQVSGCTFLHSFWWNVPVSFLQKYGSAMK